MGLGQYSTCNVSEQNGIDIMRAFVLLCIIVLSADSNDNLTMRIEVILSCDTMPAGRTYSTALQR